MVRIGGRGKEREERKERERKRENDTCVKGEHKRIRQTVQESKKES